MDSHKSNLVWKFVLRSLVHLKCLNLYHKIYVLILRVYLLSCARKEDNQISRVSIVCKSIVVLHEVKMLQ